MIVNLVRKGKYPSHVWNYFGVLTNKDKGSTYMNEYFFCKICVEEKHLLNHK